SRTYFSVGGGFVRDEAEMQRNLPQDDEAPLPYPFTTAAELVAQAEGAGLSIADLMLQNELVRRPLPDVEAGLDAIFGAMEACIERGVREHGELPGGLKVKRRAAQVHSAIMARVERAISDPPAAMDFVN